MARIKRLSPIIANQIAAGEVVERPSSVLKELLENSLDAHASSIDIQIIQGGTSLIRVQDNGDGIPKADLALALARHATSKVSKQADLSHIQTLGFRGEALASIASVSKCQLTSKPAKQSQAWSVQVKGDNLDPYLTQAPPLEGTTVEVRDLFYNTPARRKFIKSVRTEFNHIDQIVKYCALAHPQVRFSLSHQEKKVRMYPQASPAQRVAQVFGQSFLQQACYFEFENHGYSLHGWLGSPQILRKSNEAQAFFVNHRPIHDKLINHAIKNAYLTQDCLLSEGFVCYVLYLSCSPENVDVNVHPTKHEVRFDDPGFVHDFIQTCIRDALLGFQSDTTDNHPKKSSVSERRLQAPARSLPHVPRTPSLSLDLEVFKPKVQSKEIFWHHYYIRFDENLHIVDLIKQKDYIWDLLLKQVQHTPIPSRICLFPASLKTHIKSCDELAHYGFMIKRNIQQRSILSEVPIFLDEAMIQSAIDLLESKQGRIQPKLHDFFKQLSWKVFSHVFFREILKSPKLKGGMIIDQAAFETLISQEPVEL